MNDADITVPDTPVTDRKEPIGRLLFIADAAVADVNDLPPAVRAMIDAAAEVHAKMGSWTQQARVLASCPGRR